MVCYFLILQYTKAKKDAQ